MSQHRVFDNRTSSMIITKTESRGPDMNITYSNKSFNPCKRTNSTLTSSSNNRNSLADKMSSMLLKENYKKS